MQRRELQADEVFRLMKHYQETERLAKEMAEQDIRKGYWFIQYEKMEFERREVMQGEISMILPKSFDTMAEEVIRAKYPQIDRPDVIYTNSDSKINLTYSINTELVDNEEADEVRKQMMTQIERIYPESLRTDGSVEVGSQVVSYFSFVVPVPDGTVYHLMYFLEMHQQLLVGGFNCNGYDQKEWEPVFLQMMQSVEFLSLDRR